MTEIEQRLFITIDKLQKDWSDSLEIAFNGVISMREQVKELTRQVEVLTQEIKELREERRLFSGEDSL